MIIGLLAATLLVASGVSALAALLFARPIRGIMNRIIPEEISGQLYSTTIGALGAITWMLLVFFIFALVAYVLVRAVEIRRVEAGVAMPGVPAGGA